MGAVIAELQKRLFIPSGLALIWWNVRTNFAKTGKVARRLRALRNAINKRQLFRLSPAARARQRRRASTTCHITRAGIPTAKSRMRAIRDTAKAVSPGNAEKIAHDEVTALLHAQCARNNKKCRANRQGDTLQDDRVNDGRVHPNRVKSNPDFAGSCRSAKPPSKQSTPPLHVAAHKESAQSGLVFHRFGRGNANPMG